MLKAILEQYRNGERGLPTYDELIAIAEGAQADARPVGEWVKHRHWDAPHLKWAKGYVAKIGDKLYTHPEASAPRLSERERYLIDKAAERLREADFIDEASAVRAILTRASAATVGEPTNTELAQAFEYLDQRVIALEQQAEPSDAIARVRRLCCDEAGSTVTITKIDARALIGTIDALNAKVSMAARQQAEPESVIKRQAQKIGELIADRDSWIEAHARLYRLYHDQSPRAGEEIHVNVEGGDVYTLPLQLSGMDKPRFVVHVPCSPQAEPGADERSDSLEFRLRDAIKGMANCIADPMWPSHAEVSKANLKRWHKLLHDLRAAQSGQRAGVAEDANLLRDAAEKGLDINQQPQLGCVEVWAGKGDDALVFREYYSGHADREAATKCALKRALAAPTQQQEGQ